MDRDPLFQLTRPRKARLCSSGIFNPMSQTFQLTRPRKARPDPENGHGSAQRDFNSRAHARRDLNLNGRFYFTLLFQLTRPRKARPALFNLCYIVVDFNSRAHARRDGNSLTIFSDIKPISTHAPTQGATGSDGAEAVSFTFQLTRPRKARQERSDKSLWSKSFQLTRPRKARQCRINSTSSTSSISTHAPTQGATKRSYLSDGRAINFNSRAHARRDKQCGKRTLDRGISTHAPTQGATSCNGDNKKLMRISTHAPTQGATHRPCRSCFYANHFNSRAHARRDGSANDGW